MEPRVRRVIAASNASELAGAMINSSIGGIITALASGAALIVSGISLWETSLKQPDLQFYLGNNLAYTRDPWGSDEVLVMPITVTNSGARDGAVLSLELDLKNATTGAAGHFVSFYTADASYFGSNDDVTANKHRPKTPYSPIVVSGRTTFSGTVLFYPKAEKQKPVIDGKSDIEMTFHLVTTKPAGWVDELLASAPPPITVRAQVPNFLPGALNVGEFARLRVIDSGPEKAPEPK